MGDGEVRPIRFGDDLPDLPRVMMAYAGRSACGHVQWTVTDDGTTHSADEALGRQMAGEAIERLPLADALRERGECDKCHIEQPGLGL